MGVAGSALVAVRVLAAAVLVNAAVAKLVAPDRPRRAVRELAPSAPPRLPAVVVAAAVAGELLAAVLLLTPMAVAGAALTAVLGAAFAVLGFLGAVRGSRAPCGCFGGAGDRPLGTANVVQGVLLVLVLPGVLARGGTQLPPAATVLALAAVSSAAIALLVHRGLVLGLLVRPRLAGPAASPLTEGGVS